MRAWIRDVMLVLDVDLDLRRFYRKMLFQFQCVNVRAFFLGGISGNFVNSLGDEYEHHPREMNPRHIWFNNIHDSYMINPTRFSVRFWWICRCVLPNWSLYNARDAFTKLHPPPNSTHLSLVEFSPHMRTCFNGWRNDRSQGWASWPQLAAVSSIFVGDFSWHLQLPHDFIDFRHQKNPGKKWRILQRFSEES